ncbi:hypothetical protein ACOSQ3_007595 [Xanthoceras sorbifolium]
MGCGKSKHDDVATGNTIAVSRKKSINNNDVVDVSRKNTAGTETVGGDEKTKSLVLERKEEDTELNYKEIKHLGGCGGDQEENNGGARLISKESPNRYFSSRKEDQESIDGIVAEGKSEKSEYLTPRQEAGKDTVFSDKFEKVDESSVEEESTTGETESEVGVIEKKEEEYLMKETDEKAKAIETEVLLAPVTASAEKNLSEEKEQFIASPTKDKKTI